MICNFFLVLTNCRWKLRQFNFFYYLIFSSNLCLPACRHHITLSFYYPTFEQNFQLIWVDIHTSSSIIKCVKRAREWEGRGRIKWNYVQRMKREREREKGSWGENWNVKGIFSLNKFLLLFASSSQLSSSSFFSFYLPFTFSHRFSSPLTRIMSVGQWQEAVKKSIESKHWKRNHFIPWIVNLFNFFAHSFVEARLQQPLSKLSERMVLKRRMTLWMWPYSNLILFSFFFLFLYVTAAPNSIKKITANSFFVLLSIPFAFCCLCCLPQYKGGEREKARENFLIWREKS